MTTEDFNNIGEALRGDYPEITVNNCGDRHKCYIARTNTMAEIDHQNEDVFKVKRHFPVASPINGEIIWNADRSHIYFVSRDELLDAVRKILAH